MAAVTLQEVALNQRDKSIMECLSASVSWMSWTLSELWLRRFPVKMRFTCPLCVLTWEMNRIPDKITHTFVWSFGHIGHSHSKSCSWGRFISSEIMCWCSCRAVNWAETPELHLKINLFVHFSGWWIYTCHWNLSTHPKLN